MALVTLAGGEREEDVVVKQVDAGCNRDVGVPEEDVVGKHDGADVTKPTDGLRNSWFENKMAR